VAKIDLGKIADWEPPAEWPKITSIDVHTEGEPLRIFTGGLPELKVNTILEKRKFFRENYDHLRTSLMWEPRGHADMYGCIVTEAERNDSDFGVIFTHNEGYSSMCGHGIIAVTKAAIETGLVNAMEPVTTIRIDAPAGQITSNAKIENGKVKSVFFQNVPSFLYLSEQEIEISEIGKVKFDISYGGAFYAYVNADGLEISMKPDNFNQLIHYGMLIKNAVMNKYEIKHPFEDDLSFLYGTIFYGSPHKSNAHSRNVCIFADGEVDRSPTGTGVSGRVAMEYAKGNLPLNQSMEIESILGTTFNGKVVKETEYGPYNAVVPVVEGTANITGKHEFFIDPDDKLKNGFIFR
jgi:trans-L-3-hydroxyproline dehydratase